MATLAPWAHGNRFLASNAPAAPSRLLLSRKCCWQPQTRPPKWRMRTAAAAASLRLLSETGLQAENQGSSIEKVDKPWEVLEQDLERLQARVWELLDEGDDEAARILVDANYELLSDQLNSGHRGIQQAALLDVLAQCRLDMADRPGAECLLEQLETVMQRHRSPQESTAEIYEHMGNMYARLGKHELGLKYYSTCLEMQERMHGKDSVLLATALLGCADAYKNMGKPTDATKLYHRLLKILESATSSEDEDLVVPLSGLASALLEEGNALEAELSLTRALKIAKDIGDSGNVGKVMSMLARAKYVGDDLEASCALYSEALRLLERCSEDDSVLDNIRADYATVLTRMHRHKEAQELLTTNLLSKQMVVGPNDLELRVHLKNLATSYAASGEFDKCEPLIRRCLQLATTHFGTRSAQLMEPLEMLTTVLHRMGRLVEAEAFARQFLQISVAKVGQEHPLAGRACNCLAAILHSLKRYEEAEELMTQVLAIQDASLPAENPMLCLTLKRLIMLRRELGQDVSSLEHRLQNLEKIARI